MLTTNFWLAKFSLKCENDDLQIDESSSKRTLIQLPVTVRFSKTSRLSSQMKKYTSAKTDELNHDALKAREIVPCNNLYFSNSKMWLRRFKMLN